MSLFFVNPNKCSSNIHSKTPFDYCEINFIQVDLLFIKKTEVESNISAEGN